MSSREDLAADIQRNIANILLREWDPIGVADNPRTQDEYDRYVGGIYRLLASGSTPRTIAEHLSRLEWEQMGLRQTDPEMLIPVAEKLLSLDLNVR